MTQAQAGSRVHDRFGLLLLVLIFTYVLSAFAKRGTLINGLQVILFVAVMLLALRNGRFRRRTMKWAVITLALGSVGAITIALVHPSDRAEGITNLWTALVLLFSAVLLVREILSHPSVDLQSIFGAISAYMILGLMFAALYTAMWRFGGSGATFFAQGQVGSTQIFQYFSFTTLTTLGYGDFTAAGSVGRAVAVLEAMTGQIFLATLVARLVTAFRGPREQPPPGSSQPGGQ
jgi:uncharacterized membrane protein